MKLPTEAEILLSVVGQIDEQYKQDGDLGVDDIVKIILVPLQDRLGIDIKLFFQWLSLTRQLFGNIGELDKMDILDKRFKELEESVRQ